MIKTKYDLKTKWSKNNLTPFTFISLAMVVPTTIWIEGKIGTTSIFTPATSFAH